MTTLLGTAAVATNLGMTEAVHGTIVVPLPVPVAVACTTCMMWKTEGLLYPMAAEWVDSQNGLRPTCGDTSIDVHALNESQVQWVTPEEFNGLLRGLYAMADRHFRGSAEWAHTMACARALHSSAITTVAASTNPSKNKRPHLAVSPGGASSRCVTGRPSHAQPVRAYTTYRPIEPTTKQFSTNQN